MVKTIVRYRPPNEIIGRRELTVADLERIGIFTQKTDLAWDERNGFWLDADEAGIAKEVMEKLESPDFSNDSLGHFTIEQQEVEKAPSEPVVEGPEDTSFDEAASSTPAASQVPAARRGRPIQDNPQA